MNMPLTTGTVVSLNRNGRHGVIVAEDGGPLGMINHVEWNGERFYLVKVGNAPAVQVWENDFIVLHKGKLA